MIRTFIAPLALLGAVSLAAAAHAEDSGLLAAVVGDGATPLSDSEMGALRGGAGFLSGLSSALPPGSTTSVTIGNTTTSQYSPGNPSSASSTLSSGGTTATASSSVGSGPPPQNLSLSQTFGSTSTISTSHTLSFQLKI